MPPRNIAPTSGPVEKALVAKLRANTAISDAAVGGIHEGVNARKTIVYPYIVYSPAFLPIERAWGSAMLVGGWDIIAYAMVPDEARTLDQLITDELDDGELSVPGLTTLIVSRSEELALPSDRNAEGKKVARKGATYSIWVDQNNLEAEYE